MFLLEGVMKLRIGRPISGRWVNGRNTGNPKPDSDINPNNSPSQIELSESETFYYNIWNDWDWLYEMPPKQA